MKRNLRGVRSRYKFILAIISNFMSKKTSGKMPCFGKGFRSFGGMELCCTETAGIYASDLPKGMQNFCVTHVNEV